MLLDYRELSLNKAVDDCSAVWMGCVNCYVISSIKASLTISFCLTITHTLNSLRTWLAYSRAFLHPTMHQTRANPSRKWLQSQRKNRVKNPRSRMGVASLLNNRPFPSAQNWAKPGSVKTALDTQSAGHSWWMVIVPLKPVLMQSIFCLLQTRGSIEGKIVPPYFPQSTEGTMRRSHKSLIK